MIIESKCGCKFKVHRWSGSNIVGDFIETQVSVEILCKFHDDALYLELLDEAIKEHDESIANLKKQIHRRRFPEETNTKHPIGTEPSDINPDG